MCFLHDSRMRRSWALMALLGCLIGVSAVAQRPQLSELRTFDAEPGAFFVDEGILYFAGAKDGANNVEPWTSDGTPTRTMRRGDIWEGPGGSHPHQYVYVGSDSFYQVRIDRVFFVAENVWQNGAGGEGLYWLYAMPRGGGAPYRYYTPDHDVDPHYYSRVAFGDVSDLYSQSNSGLLAFGTFKDFALLVPMMVLPPFGVYPFKVLVTTINASGAAHVRDITRRPVGRYAFSANDGSHGHEYVTTMIVTDEYGNESLGHTVHDLRPGAAGSSPESLMFVQLGSDGMTFFTANDGTHGRELWVDRGGSNIQMVKDINAGLSGSNIRDMSGPLYGSIVFAAMSAEYGWELWKSDGTASGTVLVKDIRPGNLGSAPYGMCLAKYGSFDAVYFAADNGSNGTELWRSDGTPGGTWLVKDIRPGAAGADPSDFVAMGGKCYFTADAEGDGRRELWVTNGSDSGTYVVADWLHVGASPRQLIADDQRMYFTEGNTLYAFDPAGTPPPAAPSGLWGRALTTRTIQVGWNDNSSDESAFVCYIGNDGQPPSKKAQTLDADDTFTVISGPYAPNTRITFSVRSVAGEFADIRMWSYSLWPPDRYISVCTHAELPIPGVNVVSIYPLEVNTYHADDTYAFTNPLGFDDQQLVSGFAYAWNMMPSYTFSGSEPVWNTEYLYVSPNRGSGSYYLHLRSVNRCGEARPDTVRLGPYHFDFQAPTAPGAPLVRQNSGLEMYFEWTEATDSGSGIASYDCQIGTTPGGNDVFDGNVGNTRYHEFTAVEGGSYHARVRAIDHAGNIGPWSPPSQPFTLSEFGSLQVTINPVQVRFLGAQWRRKGAFEWRNSGHIETQVWAGNRVIEFKAVPGWLSAADQTVTILPDTLATATGWYAENGYLTVTIEPPAAVAAGAKWRLWRDPLLPQDSWKDSGYTDSLPLGSYLIEFKPVAGWNTPDSIGVTISGPGTVERTGVYTVSNTGSLRVDIFPTEAVGAGAYWRRKGTEDWLGASQTESLVAVGDHIIEFKPIAGWTRPSEQSVTVALGQTTVAQGYYELKSGALQVTLLPAGAVAAGAQWRRAERLPDPEELDCVNIASSDVPQTCNGSTAISVLEITDPGLITDINLHLDLTCDDNSDLEITLYAVTAGREAFPVYWASGANMHDTIFDEQAAIPLADGTAPYTGAFRPDSSFSDLIGIPAAGTWHLIITDYTAAPPEFATVLNSWSLCITTDEMVLPKGTPDGAGPWRDSGVTETDVPVGAYRLEFSPVAGWTAPEDMIVTVALNATTEETAEYAQTGALTVTLFPVGAVSAGAQWRIADAVTWNNTGETISNLENGFYEVEFKTVSGWNTPQNIIVAVLGGVNTQAEGVYIAHTGMIQVSITPAAAANAGAKWRRTDGASWFSSGDIEEVPLGAYTIEFSDIVGWTKPSNQTVTISSQGQIVTLSAAYTGGCSPYFAEDTPLPLVAANTLISELTIAEEGYVQDVNVLLDITCNSTSALDVRLESPMGTEVILFSELGHDGQDFEQTGFDDSAAISIFDDFAPYSDIYIPQEPLAAFNGEAVAGVWMLKVTDLSGGIVGSLNGWLLCIAAAEDVEAFHNADQDRNNRISLSELLRVIQFFNSGGYHCAVPSDSTEDGYVPGANPAQRTCIPHASDYNTQNWIINLSELLRLIQFYNAGGYYGCPSEGTEDGFCVGLPPGG